MGNVRYTNAHAISDTLGAQMDDEDAQFCLHATCMGLNNCSRTIAQHYRAHGDEPRQELQNGRRAF